MQVNYSFDHATVVAASSWRRSAYLFLVFLFSPLLALILAIINYRNRISRQVIFLVLVFFGLTLNFFGDGVGEAMKFTYWSNYNFDDLLTYLGGLYQTGNNVDFVQQVIMYLISRVTDNPSIYFGVISSIFAFFYLRSLGHIYDHNDFTGNQSALVHFWFFPMVLSVSYLGGSRWAIAAWIFFYSVYHFFMKREKKYIFLSVVSIFVHFSFFGPVAIFLGFLLSGRRNTIYYFLIAASFFIQTLTSSSLSQIETNSLAGVQERVSMYNNEDEIEFRQEILEDTPWYIKYPRKMVWIYLAVGIFYARKKYSNVSNDPLLENFYSFSLLLFVLANSLLKIPSGMRFQTIFFMFATVYLIMLLARAKPNGLSTLTIIGLIPMTFYFMVELRRCFDLLNLAMAAPLPVSFFANVSLFSTQ